MPRGGKRDGAGRPKGTTIEDPKIKYSTIIKKSILSWLKKQKIPAARIIEDALINYRNNKEK